jgi:dihydrodipicolinate synthase/N-acetylneuraminate lyase
MPSPRFSGIIPPMVTPLRGIDELDAAGLERLIERLISGGVRGLFILGTTGEGPSLSHRLRRELIERTCRQVANRIPVLVGITDTAFVECLEIARHSAESGAAAVVAAPPYYLPESQPELLEWLADLHEGLPLPLMLYNMPALTKVAIEVGTVRRAMEFENIVGLKDSSGDLDYFREILELRHQRPDWSVLIGPEEKLAEADAAGGDGGVCGGANIFPRLHVALHDAASGGNTARVAELQRLVLLASDQIYGVGLHASRIIKGIKCALSCLGVCEDFMAAPFRAFRDPERKRIAETVRSVSAELQTAGLS